MGGFPLCEHRSKQSIVDTLPQIFLIFSQIPLNKVNPSQLDVDQAAPSDRDKQPSEVEENSDILKSED